MFHVEKMEVDDFPFAVQLATTMNWNMTIEDFAFMVKLEPLGCHVQFHGQERVGIATSVSFGKVGWFGNFVVKENFRGEGAGSILMKHAIDYLKSKGVETIGLYAYPHLIEFYESFGFEPDEDFLVLHGASSLNKKNVKKLARYGLKLKNAVGVSEADRKDSLYASVVYDLGLALADEKIFPPNKLLRLDSNI